MTLVDGRGSGIAKMIRFTAVMQHQQRRQQEAAWRAMASPVVRTPPPTDEKVKA